MLSINQLSHSCPLQEICSLWVLGGSGMVSGDTGPKNGPWAVQSSTPRGHFGVWDKLIAQISHNFAAGRDAEVVPG